MGRNWAERRSPTHLLQLSGCSCTWLYVRVLWAKWFTDYQRIIRVQLQNQNVTSCILNEKNCGLNVDSNNFPDGVAFQTSTFFVEHHHHQPDDTVIQWFITTDFSMCLVVQLTTRYQMICIATILIHKSGRSLFLKPSRKFLLEEFFMHQQWLTMPCIYLVEQWITMCAVVTCFVFRYCLPLHLNSAI